MYTQEEITKVIQTATNIDCLFMVQIELLNNISEYEKSGISIEQFMFFGIILYEQFNRVFIRSKREPELYTYFSFLNVILLDYEQFQGDAWFIKQAVLKIENCIEKIKV